MQFTGVYTEVIRPRTAAQRTAVAVGKVELLGITCDPSTVFSFVQKPRSLGAVTLQHSADAAPLHPTYQCLPGKKSQHCRTLELIICNIYIYIYIYTILI